VMFYNGGLVVGSAGGMRFIIINSVDKRRKERTKPEFLFSSCVQYAMCKHSLHLTSRVIFCAGPDGVR